MRKSGDAVIAVGAGRDAPVLRPLHCETHRGEVSQQDLLPLSSAVHCAELREGEESWEASVRLLAPSTHPRNERKKDGMQCGRIWAEQKNADVSGHVTGQGTQSGGLKYCAPQLDLLNVQGHTCWPLVAWRLVSTFCCSLPRQVGVPCRLGPLCRVIGSQSCDRTAIQRCANKSRRRHRPHGAAASRPCNSLPSLLRRPALPPHRPPCAPGCLLAGPPVLCRCCAVQPRSPSVPLAPFAVPQHGSRSRGPRAAGD